MDKKELRKIIREELAQLNEGSWGADPYKDGVITNKHEPYASDVGARPFYSKPDALQTGEFDHWEVYSGGGISVSFIDVAKQLQGKKFKDSKSALAAITKLADDWVKFLKKHKV